MISWPVFEMNRASLIHFRMVIATMLLLSSASLSAGADSIRQPSIRPKALIPPLAKAPTIDGVLSEGEWPTLHVARWVGSHGDYLAERAGEFWVGSDGRQLYIAVRTVVHPTLGAVAGRAPRKGDEDAEKMEEDDSVEIWVGRSAFGGKGEYQIILNPAGAVWDALNKETNAGWTAVLKQAHRVQDGVWVAEVAIDLKSLSIDDIMAPISLRVCRNFQNPREQCRWAPKVTYFSVAQTMPAVVFNEGAPIVSETGFQDVNGIRMGIDLSNPGTNSLPLKVRLSCQVDQEEPGSVLEQSFDLPPGETRRMEIVKPLVDAQLKKGTAFGEILVRSAKGGICYHRDVRWRLRPPNALWDN